MASVAYRQITACNARNPSGLRQQILSSTKTASEKAELFLLKSKVNDLSQDEWRELIAGNPEVVEKGIVNLKSAEAICCAVIA
ncbi:TPA: hypothetical protein ACH3X1_013134 [Trebouxia sp. C0004]